MAGKSILTVKSKTNLRFVQAIRHWNAIDQDALKELEEGKYAQKYSKIIILFEYIPIHNLFEKNRNG